MTYLLMFTGNCGSVLHHFWYLITKILHLVITLVSCLLRLLAVFVIV